ncbi:MAG: RNase adapter RapZ [Eubacterium sp.]|nr:RNase adapter RapZ [Eubacterium sp.]
MNTEFVIVTGISGSGKSCAVNVLEDIGYYCIDNMPPLLISRFAEICEENEEITKAAIVTDIRGGTLFLNINEIIEELKGRGLNIKVLFVDANRAVVKRRYKETRRPHPLFDIANGDIDKAIEAEAVMLEPMRAIADYYIDTSLMSTSTLKENVINLFLDNPSDSMTISCMSFGFKYGVPNEADLVFDVRCLPNPFYIPELKTKTGLDAEVRDYVMKFDSSKQLEQKLYDLIDFLIPQYLHEGKSQLVIAFGCTGGKHRSVTFAQNMYDHIKQGSFKVRVLHRDLDKVNK